MTCAFQITWLRMSTLTKYERKTRSRARKILSGYVYNEASDLPNGILPTKKQIIECMMYLLRPSTAGKNQRSKEDAAKILASVLQDHWLYCNIYTIDKRYISKKILDLYSRFQTNLNRPVSQQSDKWKSQMIEYNTSMELLFDIFCNDKTAKKKKEN